jgi:hypothetical protein
MNPFRIQIVGNCCSAPFICIDQMNDPRLYHSYADPYFFLIELLRGASHFVGAHANAAAQIPARSALML